jgi:hypothetical protein
MSRKLKRFTGAKTEANSRPIAIEGYPLDFLFHHTSRGLFFFTKKLKIKAA